MLKDLECPLATLSLARRVHISISKQGENLTPTTMNETWKNPTEATHMEDTIYVEKDRKKEKEKQHRDIHIYEKRKEKKRNIRSSIYPNKKFNVKPRLAQLLLTMHLSVS